MKSLRRKVPFFATLALALSLSLPAFAGDAKTFVKEQQSKLTGLVSAANSSENEKKLDAVFDETFDYQALAQATLKDSWAERTDAQRAQFTEVLKLLVRRAYRRNIKKTLGYQVDYTSESAADENRVVSTVAKSTKSTRDLPVSIDYVLHEVGGTWKVLDIVTEGSSLSRNYRNQFRKVIDKHGFDELLKRMRAKLDKSGDVD